MTDESVDNPLASLRSDVGDDHRMAPADADRLEAGLRVAHADRSDQGTFVPLWRRAAVIAPVVAIAVVSLTLLVIAQGETPSAAFVLTDAENVVVTLPDGSVVVDPDDGLELPDGTVLEIGDGGMATIDDVVVDVPAVLEIREGRLVSDVVATTTSTSSSTTTTTTTTTSTTTTTGAPTTTVAEAEPERTTTSAPERDRDRDRDEPREDRDRDDRDEDRPTDADADADGDEEGDGDRRDRGRDREVSDDAPPQVIEVALQLEPTDDGVRVSWDVTPLDDRFSVVISRSVGGADPAPIVTTSDASGSVVDEPGQSDGRRGPRYRLVVVDEVGGVVAAGPVQSLRR